MTTPANVRWDIEMERKEKRDRKNANHRRNEEKRFQRRVDELFRQFPGLNLKKTSGSQDR